MGDELGRLQHGARPETAGFQRARDVWVFDFEYLAIVYLRPFQIKDLAKTGDAEKKWLGAEWGLKVYTDFAHGLVADVA